MNTTNLTYTVTLNELQGERIRGTFKTEDHLKYSYFRIKSSIYYISTYAINKYQSFSCLTFVSCIPLNVSSVITLTISLVLKKSFLSFFIYHKNFIFPPFVLIPVTPTSNQDIIYHKNFIRSRRTSFQNKMILF